MENQCFLNNESFPITNVYFYGDSLFLTSGEIDLKEDNLGKLDYIVFSFDVNSFDQIDGKWSYCLDDNLFNKEKNFYMVEVWINSGFQTRLEDDFLKGTIINSIESNDIHIEFSISKSDLDVQGTFKGKYEVLPRITRIID